MLIWPRCGVLRDFWGFLSRLAESQSLSVVGVFFPGPASAPCSVVDRFLYQSGHSLFLGVEKFCLSWKERSLFFRIGGREESHRNLVVASLSNFQTIACMSMSPGGARHQVKSGLSPGTCEPGNNLQHMHNVNYGCPVNTKSAKIGVSPCQKFIATCQTMH
mgnify:CR=1 FL=1